MRGPDLPVEVLLQQRALEADWIREALAGEGGSFNRLIAPILPRLKAIARRGVRSQDAEDVVQQTAMKIFVNLKQFRFQSRFSSWAIAICS
jgi:DNA-directed RNA polymerase specialized sigma24 family protein